ncbi:hypothetical protein KK141_04395 [Dyella sp. LX-66]|uniref:hypothetical protein n=1 Tax=unclassified Dyella TaxID=2634549 RepID=UPI001BE0C398|nr:MULTISPECIES: hypothetical protein [unclassified Dyella]MBT2118197.1 hypothetical protein [Dyella sp. LX-1]MBT2138777.1 hypothetical protein [Dyella sp. LX-66]
MPKSFNVFDMVISGVSSESLRMASHGFRHSRTRPASAIKALQAASHFKISYGTTLDRGADK